MFANNKTPTIELFVHPYDLDRDNCVCDPDAVSNTFGYLSALFIDLDLKITYGKGCYHEEN